MNLKVGRVTPGGTSYGSFRPGAHGVTYPTNRLPFTGATDETQPLRRATPPKPPALRGRSCRSATTPTLSEGELSLVFPSALGAQGVTGRKLRTAQSIHGGCLPR